MIGEMDERTQVHKLWFGLRKEIQHDLWHEKLNPEISTLEDMIAAAENIEIAQSVTLEMNGKGCTKTPTASAVLQLPPMAENGCDTSPNALLGEKRRTILTPNLERPAVSLRERERTDLKSPDPNPN